MPSFPGTLVICGAVGPLIGEVRRKVVGRHARGELVRGFEPADDQAVEALVVAFDARERARAEAALEADQPVPGALAAQAERVGVAQVDEVVGLQQLLVARALGEQAAGDAKAHAAVEVGDERQARRRDDLARQPAPVDAQPGLDLQSWRQRPSIGQPRAGAPGGSRRVEQRWQPGAAERARSVRFVGIAVAGDRPAPAGLQRVALEARSPAGAPRTALITVSCRTATSRTSTLRVKTTFAERLRVVVRTVRAPRAVR